LKHLEDLDPWFSKPEARNQAGPNQQPTLGRPSPAWPISSTGQTPQPFFKGSKVSALEELALTETKLLEQTASILGVPGAIGQGWDYAQTRVFEPQQVLSRRGRRL
jgi:hypothetical protein